MPTPSKNKPKSVQPKKKSVQAIQKSKSSYAQYTHYIGVFIILLITFILYRPSLDNDFTNWDDDDYVTENWVIRNPGNLKRMIQTPVAGNYHPLTMYSLALDWSRSSKKIENLPDEKKETTRARTFHTTNLILHLLNTALVFFFIWFLSGKRIGVSLVCSLFFGIHPMHVESVAWIAERKDVLYTLFYLMALIAYIWYREKKKNLWLILSLLSFILSLASKPAAVMLPITFLAIDYFQSRKMDWMMIIEKVPFLILSLIVGILTFKAQVSSDAVNYNQQYNLLEKLAFGSYGTLMYFVKLVFPFNLSNLYPYPDLTGKSLSIPYYIAPFILLFLLGLVYYFFRKQKVVLFGLAFFFINIILVLQFLAVGQAMMADRYTYVPYIGLFFILGWWLDEVPDKQNRSKSLLRPTLIAGLSVLALVCCAQTYWRCDVWQNSETLWTDTIDKFPNRIIVAYNNRGYYLRRKATEAIKNNNKPIAEKYLNRAASDYDKAMQINPEFGLTWANKGNVFLDRNRNDSAIFYYNKALSINPNLWEVYVNLGAAKANMQDYQGSIADLTLAINHDPLNAIALENRAIGYAMINDHTKSISDYRKLLELNPNDHGILNAIAVGYQFLKKFQESITEFNKAISLAPKNGMYFLNRSYSWNALGDLNKARQDAQTAINLGTSVPPEYKQLIGM